MNILEVGNIREKTESEVERVEQTTARSIQRFFSKRASWYEFFFFTLLSYEKVTRSLFQERNILQSNMKIMDAGTGTGLLTKVLYSMAREKGFSDVVFQAFDLTEGMLNVFKDWIRKEGAEGAVTTRINNVLELETLPTQWHDYDLVVTASMLEYVPRESLPKAVAGLLERVKPGGKMIWILSGNTPLMKFIVGWFWRGNLYTKSELNEILKKVGATDINYLSFPRPYQATNRYMLAVEFTRP